MAHRSPGPAPQVEKREEFVRLIARGVPNAEACRIVGINRRTGTRWRFGRTITGSGGQPLHYAPVSSTPTAQISPRYLSEDERIKIADLRRAGLGVRDIAGRTGRSPATISRELRRNQDPETCRYRPFAAHRLAVQRRGRRRPGKIARDPVLRRFRAGPAGQEVEPGTDQPRAARRIGAHPPERHVVHKTIYQAVYRPDLGGLARDLPRRR